MPRARLSTGTAEFLRVWGLAVAVVLAGFLVTWHYVRSPPPRVIRIATGTSDGAYYAFAMQYAERLARDGIVLEVVPTAGSVENIERLERGDVSLALVQGGCATDEDRARLQSLGSVFLEPVWLFTPAATPVRRLSQLEGARVEVGARGSGTDRLARQLLDASGVSESNTTFVHSGPGAAAESLARAAVDAVFVVASPQAPMVRQLIGHAGVELAALERTAAYSRRFPFLTPVTLEEGVLDLARNLPARDTVMLATAASLAARPDLHPALVPALLDAVTRVHESGGVLARRGDFPSSAFVDLPLNEDADRYIREGPSFLYRWLPYGTAVVLDRLKLLLLPLLALLLPLFRVAPPLYQWRVRSRIYRWYAEVRDIDGLLLGGTLDDTAALADRLLRLEREVASISVPLAYAGEQYHLRLHIRLLQERLQKLASVHHGGGRRHGDTPSPGGAIRPDGG